MEEEAIRVLGWKVGRDFTTLCATMFPVLASLIMVVLFLWTIWSECEAAEKASINSGYSNWGFCIGVLTLVLGFLFLAAGFPLLADLVIKLLEQLQNHEESRKHQGGKLKTICIISRLAMSVIAMFMLAWAINTGTRLASEPRREGKYYPLASPVGVVTIMFGFTYSIIGLCVIAELALELIKQLQSTEKEELVNHQVGKIDVKFFV
ncbi:PREDICTED: LOC110805639 [Prunus dulcis]|uniref:PREDICTED: LOC110805639 n=2 Tax=Prunus dulcis TaxID=3755 RepID=A0A5E4GB39_PRUDU|nr:PREDICTED: LOC110805639 [Prunus dulcis]